MSSRPHISAAVQELRTWVIACAVVVVLSAAAQLVIFGFARYTDVRFVTLQGSAITRPPRTVVVQSQPASAAARAPVNADLSPAPPDPNRVLSVADRNMALVSNSASASGLIAAVALALLTMLGVAVAGGGAIPGVERAVKAAVWAIVVALLCLPWSAFAGQTGSRDLLPGVFAGYSSLLFAVERAEAGAAGVIIEHVILPTVVVVMSICVAYWFHTGVERGIIITSVSQLDRQVEREVAAIAKAGVSSLHAPRTMGVLDQAIGEVPPPPLRMTGTDSPRRPI